MRNLLSTVLLLAATLAASAQNDLKSVLSQLDATLSHRDSYIAGREQRIESLKNILRKSDFSDAQRYILNQQLIDEYTPYQADSTIDYLYRNIALATRMNDAGHLNESRIQLAYLYSSAGIYLEAANMLKLVDTTALDRRQLVDYYIARHKLNDELQLYSHDSAQGHESWRLTVIYAQLIVENTEPESVTHLNFRLRQAIGARDYPQAVEISERLCSTLQPLSREYAEASYMRIVMDDARFFNSRLRPWQDALALHVIEEAYRVRRQRMDAMYNIFVVSIGCFMLLALGGVVFVLRQNRKLNLARLELQQANNRLNISNKDLQHINKRLAGLNSQISEANEMKEEYIGIFLTMCSEYIDKIIDSRRHVRRLLRDGRVDELRKEYSPTDGDSRELEEFYRNFDTTFLQLYPTFIEDFNSLLDKEARIEPKKGELLTTELRIFALIRLGINDSSKIAALLRYSVSTIYNYRSKIKGHTLVSRDDFEERIKTIGAFSPQHL